LAKRAKEQGFRDCLCGGGGSGTVHQETLRGVFNRYRREAMAFKRIIHPKRIYLYDFARA